MRQTYKSYNASAIKRIAITKHYAPMILAPSSKISKNNKTQKYSYLYYMFIYVYVNMFYVYALNQKNKINIKYTINEYIYTKTHLVYLY